MRSVPSVIVRLALGLPIMVTSCRTESPPVQPDSQLVEDIKKSEPKISVEETEALKKDLAERKQKIEKLEKIVAHNLVLWASRQSGLLLQIHLISDDDTEIGKTSQAAINIILATQQFGETITNIDKLEPTPEDIEILIMAVNRAGRASMYLNPFLSPSEEELIAKAEKILTVKKEDPKNIKHYLEELKAYLKNYKRIAQVVLPSQKASLIKAIEKYNSDAKKAGIPDYESIWGLSPEILKSLKSIE